MPRVESQQDSRGQALDRERRSLLGQFFTPSTVAGFMASFFETPRAEIGLLDAGAGAGALTKELVSRFCREHRKPERISVTAFELDSTLIESLRATLSECEQRCEQAGISFSATVFNEDFIAAAVPMVRGDLFASQPPQFNMAIVNPPYHKIHSDSPTRLLLRSAGIETSNLYTGFVMLIVKLLVKGGELVAITPRSFCNGPYFKPFRLHLLETMSLLRLHVFESRSTAFSDDDVLQENVIVHAVKGETKPRRVIISSSSGKADDVVTEREVDYRDVVSPDDSEQFIRLLVDDGQTKAKSAMDQLPATLADLGLTVSTGRVVDVCFRQFSGHTQVNATDLRVLNYPAKAALERLGRKIDDPGLAQEQLDNLVEEELFR